MPRAQKHKKAVAKKIASALKPSTLLEFSYSYHSQPSDWAKVVGIAIFCLLILVLVLADQLITAGLITLAGLTLAIMTTAPAHKLHYRFDANGLAINSRHWFWHEFRSYSLSVNPDDVKITLFPIYRLYLPSVLHVPYDKVGDAQKILRTHLPQQQTLYETLTDLFLRSTRL